MGHNESLLLLSLSILFDYALSHSGDLMIYRDLWTCSPAYLVDNAQEYDSVICPSLLLNVSTQVNIETSSQIVEECCLCMIEYCSVRDRKDVVASKHH